MCLNQIEHYFSALILRSILNMLKFGSLASPLDLSAINYVLHALIKHLNISILFPTAVNRFKCNLCVLSSSNAGFLEDKHLQAF